MRGKPIETVVVAGDGIVAWSAAAAIRRQLPALSVTVVRTAVPPDAFADRIGCTLPSISEFHQDIGLGDADAIVRAGSGLRLGTRFAGWAEGLPEYVHAYGDYGTSLGAAPFHQHWVRALASGAAAAFDDYSPGAAIGRAGGFAPPGAMTSTPARFGFGLHVDPPRYRQLMRDYARHLGTAEQEGAIAGVRLDDRGFVAALKLDDASEVVADLFVDATGPQALVRTALGGERQDWSGWLLADRVLFGETAPDASGVLDTVTAVEAGWTWAAPSPSRTSVGMVYSSRHSSDELAADSLDAGEMDTAVAFSAGRWSEPWARNCVAVGDAAVAIEPLEWTNLHLAHSAIDRLVALMPDSDCAAVELWDYNRQVNAESDRVRDFLVMHYVTASRPDDRFWRKAASVELPESLAHTLTQFRERGRLPFYEEETFSRDGWLAVLLGQGVVPRRLDPLLDTVPAEQSERAMAQMLDGIAELAGSIPPHSHFLETLRQRLS